MNYSNQPESQFIGRLSLSTYFTIGMIIGIGTYLLCLAYWIIMFLYGIITGNTPPMENYAMRTLQAMGLNFVGAIATAIGTSLATFPIYLWVCKRRGGQNIKGYMIPANSHAIEQTNRSNQTNEGTP